MKKIIWIFAGVLCTQTACDLQPKILSFPDSVGEFISARYPALLADPNTQPEIYNSAVTDYGMYASPNLYGSPSDDAAYVTYASVNDYIVPPQQDVAEQTSSQQVSVSDSTDKTEDYLVVPMYGRSEDNTDVFDTDVVTVAAGDTLYKIAKQNGLSVDQIAELNNLSEPYALSVGQKLHVRRTVASDVKSDDMLTVANKPVSAVQTVTRVQLQDITVASGDTLYSLSRKYSVPVNDLAVMNNLTAPFNLHVGQNLRVPDLANAPVVQDTTIAVKQSADTMYGKPTIDKKTSVDKSAMVTTDKPASQSVKKISSDPAKKLPTISARSSSKFSWPVRGKILSNYGAKSSGLFNDGINIGATRGTPVKAAENGVVAYAGNEVKGMGNLIIIQHAGGWMTVYAHMDSMSVRRGARVKVGQQIGTVGETGKVDTPQLHFEIRNGTKAYNPSSHLK